MIEDLLEIRPSKFGRGLFAKEKIEEGTIICETGGKEMSFDETIQLDDESHSLQIDYDRYVLCEPPFLFSNHSCNPNCGLNAQHQLFALRPIQKDEELFWDYSTSMLERHWTMKCNCGEKNCRSIITDFDLLPHSVQQFYLQKNAVLPFIVLILNQQFSKTA
jgi:SET domain-containing protein